VIHDSKTPWKVVLALMLGVVLVSAALVMTGVMKLGMSLL
jgi:hypothetical protein